MMANHYQATCGQMAGPPPPHQGVAGDDRLSHTKIDARRKGRPVGEARRPCGVAPGGESGAYRLNALQNEWFLGISERRGPS